MRVTVALQWKPDITGMVGPEQKSYYSRSLLHPKSRGMCREGGVLGRVRERERERNGKGESGEAGGEYTRRVRACRVPAARAKCVGKA